MKRPVSRIAYLAYANDEMARGTRQNLLELNSLTPATSFEIGAGRLHSLFHALPQREPIKKMNTMKVMATQIHVAMLEAPKAKRKTNSKRSSIVIGRGRALFWRRLTI